MSEGNSGTASIDTEGKYEAKLFTLDSFNYDKIDYLKVDIEGFELQFLKGATETIKRTKPTYLYQLKSILRMLQTNPSMILICLRLIISLTILKIGTRFKLKDCI